MYKVTWSKKFYKSGSPLWSPSMTDVETHIKEYPTLNAIYGDVEVAWSKGYVPRMIECGEHYDRLVCITNSPNYIGSVYKNLKLHIGLYEQFGGFIQKCMMNRADEERWRKVNVNDLF